MLFKKEITFRLDVEHYICLKRGKSPTIETFPQRKYFLVMIFSILALGPAMSTLDNKNSASTPATTEVN